MDAMRQLRPNLKWHVTHAEEWFCLATEHCVRTLGTPKAVRRSALELYERARREGRTETLLDFKRRFVDLHQRRLTTDVFDRFFMLDRLPQNRLRFERARARVVALLERLRATRQYVL
jgi:hypothetical protein